MKNEIIITIILTCLLSFPTQAQMLIKENKIWSIASCGTEGACIFTTNHYMIGEEIYINDILYHKIMYSNSYNPYRWSWPENTSFIREKDSIVYRRRNPDEEEYAVFNFRAKVGESFKLTDHQVVYTVDSIVTRNIQGLDLKHWYIKDKWGERGIQIEKIGSFSGFMQERGGLGADVYILCISEDGEIFYRNKNINSCHIYTIVSSAGQLDKAEEPIRIIPQNNRQVLINNHTETEGEIVFFTTDGREVKHSFLNNCETLLQLPQSGLFIYRFRSDNGEVQTGKVLVK